MEGKFRFRHDALRDMKVKAPSEIALASVEDQELIVAPKPYTLYGLLGLSGLVIAILLWRIFTLSSELSLTHERKNVAKQETDQALAKMRLMSADLDQARKDLAARTYGGDKIALNELNDTRDQLAVAMAALGKFSEAVRIENSVIAVDPTRAQSWGNLSWCQFQNAEFDSAIESGKKALQLNPKLNFVVFNIGLMYACNDDWTNSKVYYDKALEKGTRADKEAAAKDVENQMMRKGQTETLLKAKDYLQKSLLDSIIPEAQQ